MYKASGGRRSKVQQRRRISKQQRRSRTEETGKTGETVDPNWVVTRTLASDPTHVPLFTTEEKRNLMLYSNLESLPKIASSRRHEVEGANNGGRRRGRRISRRRR